MPRAKSQEPRAKSQDYALKERLKQYSTTYRILRFIKRVIIRIKLLFFWSPYIIFYKTRNFFKHDVIFSQCWLSFKGYTVYPNNWGDDLNKFFFEYAAKVKMAVLPQGTLFFLSIKHYSLIGSIIGSYSLNNCIIYGSGLTAYQNPSGRPEKIISVRGPLTRDVMIKKGYDCPRSYGDPALLLPIFYFPKRRETKKISLIPHLATLAMLEQEADKNISMLIEKYDCRIISMVNYDKWTDIIDEINSSSFVISESLHGLITAETYNIPCVWVEFIDHTDPRFHNNDWGFKYRDFYESIGKYNMQSVKLYEGYDFDELLSLRDKWKPGRIDYKKLLEYFPFEIKPEFKSQITEFLRTHK